MGAETAKLESRPRDRDIQPHTPVRIFLPDLFPLRAFDAESSGAARCKG
jgi:hypothetical protein